MRQQLADYLADVRVRVDERSPAASSGADNNASTA
jgi:hypothetical protein